jgi:polysaccharide biosynthesis/export protein
MRVLPIAIGTLSALAVQELGLTRNTSPNKNPDELHDRNPAESDDYSVDLSEPIATPERLPVPGFTQSPSSKKPSGLDILKLDSQQKVALSRPYAPLQPLKLGILPLDDIVSDTLKSRAKKPGAIAQPSVTAAAKATSEQPVKPLADIQGHWAQPFIEALADRNVVRGFSDGRFQPDKPITSAEFSTMARKAMPQQLLTVADLQKSYPDRLATRAEAAAFLYQAMSQAGQAPAIAAAETVVASAAGAGAKQSPEKVAKAKLVEKSNTLAFNSNLAERNASIAPPTNLLPVPTPPLGPTPLPSPTPTPSVRPTPIPSRAISQTNLNTPLPPDNPPIPTRTAASIPPEQDYVLGGGDSIRLDVFDVPEYSKEYKVLVNGTLNLPLVGSVAVGGLTLQQAGNLLSAKYAPYLTRPRVTVNLLAPRPLSFAVSGEVNRPGSYTIALNPGEKFPTLSRAVQMAGGFTQGANLQQVEVRRPQKSGTDQVIRVDMMQLLRSGDLRQDLTLRDGDTVSIPAATSPDLAASPQLAASNLGTDFSQPINIAVVGAVMRPGPHTLAKSDKATDKSGGLPTVTKAIQQAGGISQLADLRRVEVHRTARSGTEQIINVNLWDLLQSGDLKQDLILQQGDRVVIPTAKALSPAEATRLAAASFSPDTMKVNVVGEVIKPGTIEVPPNTPLNQALLNAGGFNNRARKKSVQLIRLNPNGTVTQQNITVDLSTGISDQGNPMLQNNDIVVVGRSNSAKLSDTLNDVLTPLGRILPLFLLF